MKRWILLILAMIPTALTAGIDKGDGRLPDRWTGYISEDINRPDVDNTVEFRVSDAIRTADHRYIRFCDVGSSDVNILRLSAELEVFAEDKVYHALLMCFDKNSDRVSIYITDKDSDSYTISKGTMVERGKIATLKAELFGRYLVLRSLIEQEIE